ncbi:small integral membrane protein 29-like [Lineus longissimus]|uniref:small integral membrane protein 29-like n=1 Tax=Lineus longissimus TaxID=88925 RepID=UPI002B4DAF77
MAMENITFLMNHSDIVKYGETPGDSRYHIIPGLTIVPPPTSTPSSVHNGSNSVLVAILVPLGCLGLIALFAFMVVFLLKKSRLDKLRHHLMPLYNFDPAEEEGDWESELLEEDKEQQVALRIQSPSDSPTSMIHQPKLKFTTDTLEL